MHWCSYCSYLKEGCEVLFLGYIPSPFLVWTKKWKYFRQKKCEIKLSTINFVWPFYSIDTIYCLGPRYFTQSEQNGTFFRKIFQDISPFCGVVDIPVCTCGDVCSGFQSHCPSPKLRWILQIHWAKISFNSNTNNFLLPLSLHFKVNTFVWETKINIYSMCLIHSLPHTKMSRSFTGRLCAVQFQNLLRNPHWTVQYQGRPPCLDPLSISLGTTALETFGARTRRQTFNISWLSDAQIFEMKPCTLLFGCSFSSGTCGFVNLQYLPKIQILTGKSAYFVYHYNMYNMVLS